MGSFKCAVSKMWTEKVYVSGRRNRPPLVTPTSITVGLQFAKSMVSLFCTISSTSRNRWLYMLFSTLGNSASVGSMVLRSVT